MALGGGNSGIEANTQTHSSGFHMTIKQLTSLGKRWSDYSITRDPAGSDGPFPSLDWACAGDFSHKRDPALRRKHAELLERLMDDDPSLRMICEFIGQPIASQPVKYWARWRGVTALSNYTGEGHDHWSHLSWWRSMSNQNASLWTPSGSSTGGSWMEALFCKKDDKGEIVQFWQVILKQCGFYTGAEDGDYGPLMAKAVGAARKAVQSSVTDGLVVDAHAATQILIHFVRHWQVAGTAGPAGKQGIQGVQGVKGDKGDKGEKGEPGRDGLLVLPEKVVVEALIQQPQG